MGFRKPLARLIEQAYGHTVAIGPATDKLEVAKLIDAIRPWDSNRRLVRIGPDGDGGYLAPDDLEDVLACVSPGVSIQSGFDFDIAQKGIDVHMADGSVDGPSIRHPRFYFEKKFFGPTTNGQTITIQDFCERIPGFASGRDLILQMDIEAAEYSIIQSMSVELLNRFRFMIIEFHGLDNLFHSFSFDFIKAAFDKLLETHRVIHLHPNNCCGSKTAHGIEIPKVMEMTFYRKNCASFVRNELINYPNTLDFDNVPEKSTLPLPRIWR